MYITAQDLYVVKQLEAIAIRAREMRPIVKTVIKTKNIKLKIHDN